MLLVLKPEVIKAKKLSVDDQERILLECSDEVRYGNAHPLAWICLIN
jgi:hypothetical protein